MRMLSGFIDQAAKLDDVVKVGTAALNVIVQPERTLPRDRRTGKRLTRSLISAFHPSGEIDLALTIEQAYLPHFPQIDPYWIVSGGGVLSRLFMLSKLAVQRSARPTCCVFNGSREIGEVVFEFVHWNSFVFYAISDLANPALAFCWSRFANAIFEGPTWGALDTIEKGLVGISVGDGKWNQKISVRSRALLSAPVSGTPLCFVMTSPPSGYQRNFHLRAVEYARHT
jgi:hypothetical protein